MSTPAAIEAAANALCDAQRVCVFSGAGMSAESGVATFRDEDGQWARFNPAELATPEAFQRQPARVWEWYRARRQQLSAIDPHAGYAVLAKWEDRFAQVTVVTQNVDGLHARAGSPVVHQLHGRLDVVRCTACAREQITLADVGPDPHCDDCGGRLRPGVVWFGEPLPWEAFDASVQAAETCDVLLSIGTSGVVEPAASIVRIAREHAATVVEINPTETALSHVADIHVRQGCRDALLALDTALESRSD